jgi:hypothetical protein
VGWGQGAGVAGAEALVTVACRPCGGSALQLHQLVMSAAGARTAGAAQHPRAAQHPPPEGLAHLGQLEFLDVVRGGRRKGVLMRVVYQGAHLQGEGGGGGGGAWEEGVRADCGDRPGSPAAPQLAWPPRPRQRPCSCPRAPTPRRDCPPCAAAPAPAGRRSHGAGWQGGSVIGAVASQAGGPGLGGWRRARTDFLWCVSVVSVLARRRSHSRMVLSCEPVMTCGGDGGGGCFGGGRAAGWGRRCRAGRQRQRQDSSMPAHAAASTSTRAQRPAPEMPPTAYQRVDPLPRLPPPSWRPPPSQRPASSLPAPRQRPAAVVAHNQRRPPAYPALQHCPRLLPPPRSQAALLHTCPPPPSSPAGPWAR